MAGLCLLTVAQVASANPQGGTVTHGNARIVSSGSTTTITQTTSKAIINWNDFSIKSNETTQFKQPSSKSFTLNRVTGNNASQIMGNLKSNGNIYLINPNGILFGKTARVDVGGLVASTANVSDKDFLSGHAQKFNNAPAGSSIINQGTISIKNAGLAVLVSPHVVNQGVIQANLGTVAIASADHFTLDLYGDNLISFDTGKVLSKGELDQAGIISANGGTVMLTAQAAGDILRNTINMTGVIEARSVSSKNGKIVLQGYDNSTINVSGTIDVSGKHINEIGGLAQVSADYIHLQNGSIIDASGYAGGGNINIGSDVFHNPSDNLNINTQGLPTALRTAKNVYAESNALINADSYNTGKAGNIVVWGDQATQFYGNISAAARGLNGDGGRIETSGKYLDVTGIKVNASSIVGKTGLWLLDPANITVSQTSPTANESASGGNPNIFTPTATATINGSDISTALATANVIISTGVSVADNNITFDTTFNGTNPITWSSGNSLTFLATGNIVINASTPTSQIINPTNSTGTTVINFRSDSNSDGNGTVTYTNGQINRGGAGNVTVNIYYNPVTGFATAPTDYSALISGGATQTGYYLVHNNVAGRTLADIGASATTLSRSYAMSQDMTPNATNTLGSFTAIGTAASPFTGVFTGANYTGTNYTISGLVIPSTFIQYQGLFGNVSGVNARLDNITLINPSVISAYNNSAGAVGGIAGLVQGGAVLSGDFLINATSGATIVSSSSTLGAQVGGIIGSLDANTLVAAGSTFTTKISGGTFNVSGKVRNTGGIFGVVSGAINTANDFGATSLINNANVTGSSNQTGLGGIFGSFAKEGLNVTANMTNNGSILRTAGNITSLGGVFGLLTATTTPSTFTGDMSNTGSVGSALGTNANAGGIIGGMTGVGAIMSGSLVNSGNVSGASFVGGIIGNFIGGSIIGTNANLFQTTAGTISGTTTVGGLIGGVGASSSFTRTGTTNISTSAGVIVNGTSTSANNIGGLFGTVASNATIFASGDLTNRATVNTTQTTGTATGIGGIFGNFALGGMTVSANMLNTGSIYAGSIGTSTINPSSLQLGGIFGIVASSTFTGSMISSGSVQGGGDLGGLVGRISGGIFSGSNDFKVISNGANITIGGASTGDNVGGLVGNANAGGLTRTGIIMTDISGGGSISVTHNSVTNMGGLFGLVGSFNLQPCLATSSCVIENYATLSATGGSHVGGIFGSQSSLANLNLSFNMINHANISVNGTGDSVGGIFGLTTAFGVTYSGNFFNYGSVSASNNVGGIAGATSNVTFSGNKTVGDGSATPLTLTLSSTTGSVLGGIVGSSGSNTLITTGTTTLNSNVSFVAPAGSFGVGGVIGSVAGNSTLSGTFNLVPINVLADYVGGYIGYLNGNTNLNGALSNRVNVTGGNNVGGVIGALVNGTAVDNKITGNMTNSGNISGTDSVGGVIGSVVRANFLVGSFLSNSGAVTGVSNVGGLIGNMSNAGGAGAIAYNVVNTSIFTNSGTVTGTGAVNSIGGIFGGFTATVTLTNSFTNSGNVISTNTGAFGTGGIIGDLGSNVTFTRTLTNNGTITGAGSNIGGLFGHLANANLGTSTLSLSAGGTVGGTGTNIGGMIGLIDGASVLPSTLSTTSILTGTGTNVGGVIGQSAVSLSNALTHTTGSVTGSDSVGSVIGLLNGGTLSGTLTGSTNVTATNYAGGLVGTLNNGILTGTLSHSAGTVNGGSGSGGFVGHMLNNSSIDLSHATFAGTLTGTSNLGGIVGVAEHNPVFTGAFGLASLTVTANATNVGAWIGKLLNATLTGTYTNNTILSANNSSNVAGFVGLVDGGTFTGSILNSAAVTGNTSVGSVIGLLNNGTVSGTLTGSADVTATNYAGGLVGTLNNGILTGTLSHSAGTVNGGSGSGGFVGHMLNNSSIDLSHATFAGTLTGTSNLGGIVGVAENNPVFTGAFGLASLTVTANATNVGAWIGKLLNATLTGTYTNNTILSANNSSNVAGFVGLVDGGTFTGSILNSASVTGNTSVAGLIGRVDRATFDTNAQFDNTGAITGVSNVSGLIGNMSNSAGAGAIVYNVNPTTTFTNSGTVTGTGAVNSIGGIFGGFTATVTLTNSFTNSGNVISTNTGAFGTGGIIGDLGSNVTFTRTLTNNGTIAGAGSNIGGLFGHLTNANLGTSTLSLNAGGTVGGTGTNIGGMIGLIDDASVLPSTLSSTSILTGTGTNVGGILGSVSGTANLITQRLIHTSGTVTGLNNVGSLIGNLQSGTVQEVYNVSIDSVTASGNNAGGLIGQLGSGAILKNALFGGTVTGNTAVGGLVGFNQGTIINSLGVGSVSGNSQVGALVGNNIGTLSAVIYNTDLSSAGVGSGSSEGAIGGDNRNMGVSTFYTSKGWDFATVWMQVDGYYPSLQWCDGSCRVAGTFVPPTPPTPPTPPNVVKVATVINQQIVNGILTNNPTLEDYDTSVEPSVYSGRPITLSAVVSMLPGNESLISKINKLPNWIPNQTLLLSDTDIYELLKNHNAVQNVNSIVDSLLDYYKSKTQNSH